MNATTATPASVTVVAAAPLRIAEGFAEFSGVRATPLTGRIEVRRTWIYDVEDAVHLAGEVLGAVRWIAQANDTSEPATSVEVVGTPGVTGLDGGTTWQTGVVMVSRHEFPKATLFEPRGGYTVDETAVLLGDLIGVGVFLEAEGEKYTNALVSDVWD